MKLFVLFGQRKGSYPGQYAPEALEVVDEYAHDENETWIQEQKDKMADTGEFESLAVITLEVADAEITKRLRPEMDVVKATVV
jgi:hypothetical protein